MIPYTQFVLEHSGASLEEFHARVTEAHLLVPLVAAGMEDEETGTPFLTKRLGTGAVRDMLRDLWVAPLRKSGARNAFSMMITVGRAQNNDLVLPHTAISKFHAYFREEAPGSWRLIDARSTNGTRVDGQPVTEEGLVLRSGATITLGEALTLEFLLPDDLYRRVQADLPHLDGQRPGRGGDAVPAQRDETRRLQRPR